MRLYPRTRIEQGQFDLQVIVFKQVLCDKKSTGTALGNVVVQLLRDLLAEGCRNLEALQGFLGPQHIGFAVVVGVGGVYAQV